MAQKGTYIGYGATPPLPSGQFSGADAFARMAAKKAQIKAEERAEQRQIRAEARRAMELAVEAGNIDYSKIDSSVHTIIGKIADNYSEKLVDLSEELDQNYSFAKQLEVTKLRGEFNSKIAQISGLGSQMRTIADGARENKYDSLLSTKAVNGNTSFMLQIPDMVEKFDPETMSVGGVSITEMYRQQVDLSSLVAPVDSDGAVAEFVTSTLKEGAEIIDIEGQQKITYKENSYNPRDAKRRFAEKFQGSNEFKKLSYGIYQIYDSLEDEAQQEFADKYLEKTEEGDYVVSVDKAFRYVEDNYLVPELRKLTKKEEMKVDQAAVNRGIAAQEALTTNLRKIQLLHEAGTPGGGEQGLNGAAINIEGLEPGTIKEYHLRYNPLTGQDDIAVLAEVGDKNNVREIIQRFDNNDAGRQALGKAVFKNDFDYQFARQQAEEKSGQALTPPAARRTLDQRREDIKFVLDNQTVLFEGLLSQRATDEDDRTPEERVYEYINQSFPEAGAPNRALVNFMASYLNVGDKAAGAGIKAKIPQLKVSEDGLTLAAEKVAKMTAMARSMKADGAGDKEIVNQLVKMAEEPTLYYEHDRVKRKINGMAIDEREDARRLASQLIANGANDDEIIKAIDNPEQATAAMYSDMIQEVIGATGLDKEGAIALLKEQSGDLDKLYKEYKAGRVTFKK